MKFFKTLSLSVAAFALAVSAMAQSSTQVLFDLGRHDGVNGDPVTNPATPSGGSGSFYWNSIGGPGQGQASGDSYNGFVASDNTALAGWTLTLGAGNQANGTANGGLLNPSASLLGDLAVPDAAEDYFFTTSTGALVLSGLNPGYAYDFTFFGTRESTSSRTTTYSATGSGATQTTSPLATSGAGIGTGGYNGNNDTTVSLAGISPNALGEIAIDYDVASGGFAYLGIMEVGIVVPEPSSFGLLGLGGAAFALMRRRRG